MANNQLNACSLAGRKWARSVPEQWVRAAVENGNLSENCLNETE